MNTRTAAQSQAQIMRYGEYKVQAICILPHHHGTIIYRAIIRIRNFHNQASIMIPSGWLNAQRLFGHAKSTHFDQSDLFNDGYGHQCQFYGSSTRQTTAIKSVSIGETRECTSVPKKVNWLLIKSLIKSVFDVVLLEYIISQIMKLHSKVKMAKIILQVPILLIILGYELRSVTATTGKLIYISWSMIFVCLLILQNVTAVHRI